MFENVAKQYTPQLFVNALSQKLSSENRDIWQPPFLYDILLVKLTSPSGSLSYSDSGGNYNPDLSALDLEFFIECFHFYYQML